MRTMCITVGALICTSCGPSLDDRVEDLVTAKNVWVSVAGDRPYSYTLKFGYRPPYTVSVSNPGTLCEDWLEDRECSDVDGCRVTPTMRELFQLILDQTGDQFQSGGELQVAYDERLGFPKYIYFNDRPGSHGYFLVKISNVEFVLD